MARLGAFYALTLSEPEAARPRFEINLETASVRVGRKLTKEDRS